MHHIQHEISLIYKFLCKSKGKKHNQEEQNKGQFTVINEGGPQKLEFTYKNYVFILTCLNFSYLQSTLHLMEYTYQDIFPLLKSFWTHQYWCLLVLLLFLVSPFLHPRNVSLWGLFSSRETVAEGNIGLVWQVEYRVMPFLDTNYWTLSAVWETVQINHPWWNRQRHWKSLQNNSLKPNAASHNNASWYTDTGEFLEHSPSAGSLYYKGPTFQKIILFSLVFLPYVLIK